MEKIMREFGALIGRISAGETLSRAEAREAYRQIICNEQPELQQGAFLAVHLARGATIEELCGAWEALDTFDTAKIDASGLGIVCDIVGTGSDNVKTINCSSPASIIAAACGLIVAKKGARKVTGVSGASCIFEELGVNIHGPLKQAEEKLRRHGICYLAGETFLQKGWARLIKHLRFTSVFNIVGPLTRPCPQTSVSIVGGYSPAVCDQMANILQGLSMRYAACPYGMVDGMDEKFGMDEISPCGPTRLVTLKNGKINVEVLHPKDFDIETHPISSIASRPTAKENAALIRDTLQGNGPRAVEDFFAINAGAALMGAGTASSWKEATEISRQAIRSGIAAAKLQQMIEIQP